MEFRLIVRGALPPAQHRGVVNEKHAIRRMIHPQLKGFFDAHPILRMNRELKEKSGLSTLDEHANEHAKHGYRFAPIVCRGDACALEILLMRRNDSRTVLRAGGSGDLDGRVKTLIDGLRMPQQLSELAGNQPQDGEDPFFVLMEDDCVVQEISVQTDTLYMPPEEGELERDVVAIIKVRTWGTPGDWTNVHSYR